MSEDIPASAENSAAPCPDGSVDADIAWPIVDLDGDDPIREIVESNEFAACASFFTEVEAAQRAVISPKAQALLFCTARNLKPDHIFEIGTYKASTSEAICRALHANRH